MFVSQMEREVWLDFWGKKKKKAPFCYANTHTSVYTLGAERSEHIEQKHT